MQRLDVLADSGQFLATDLPEAAVVATDAFLAKTALYLPIGDDEWGRMLASLVRDRRRPLEADLHLTRLPHLVDLAKRGFHALNREMAPLGPVARWGDQAVDARSSGDANQSPISRAGSLTSRATADQMVRTAPYADAGQRGVALCEHLIRGQNAARLSLYEAFWEERARTASDPTRREQTEKEWAQDVVVIESALKNVSGRLWDQGIVAIAYQEHIEQQGPTAREAQGTLLMALTTRMQELHPLRNARLFPIKRNARNSDGQPLRRKSGAELDAFDHIAREPLASISNNSPKVWQMMHTTGIVAQVLSEGAGNAIKDLADIGQHERAKSLWQAANPLRMPARVHANVQRWGQSHKASVIGLSKLPIRMYATLDAYVIAEQCTRGTPNAPPTAVLRSHALLENPKSAVEHFDRARLIHVTARRLLGQGLALDATAAGRVERTWLDAVPMNPLAPDQSSWLDIQRAMARDVGTPEPNVIDDAAAVHWRHAAAIAVGAMSRGAHPTHLLEHLDEGWVPGLTGTVPPIDELRGLAGAEWRVRHGLDPAGTAFVRAAIQGAVWYDSTMAEFGHLLPAMEREPQPTTSDATKHLRVDRAPSNLSERVSAKRNAYAGPWTDGWWGTLSTAYVHRFANGLVSAAAEDDPTHRRTALPFAPIAQHLNLAAFITDRVIGPAAEWVPEAVHRLPMTMHDTRRISGVGQPDSMVIVEAAINTPGALNAPKAISRRLQWHGREDSMQTITDITLTERDDHLRVSIIGPIPAALALTTIAAREVGHPAIVPYAPEAPVTRPTPPITFWGGHEHAQALLSASQEGPSAMPSARAAIDLLLRPSAGPRRIPKRVT